MAYSPKLTASIFNTSKWLKQRVFYIINNYNWSKAVQMSNMQTSVLLHCCSWRAYIIYIHVNNWLFNRTYQHLSSALMKTNRSTPYQAQFNTSYHVMLPVPSPSSDIKIWIMKVDWIDDGLWIVEIGYSRQWIGVLDHGPNDVPELLCDPAGGLSQLWHTGSRQFPLAMLEAALKEAEKLLKRALLLSTKREHASLAPLLTRSKRGKSPSLQHQEVNTTGSPLPEREGDHSLVVTDEQRYGRLMIRWWG